MTNSHINKKRIKPTQFTLCLFVVPLFGFANSHEKKEIVVFFCDQYLNFTTPPQNLRGLHTLYPPHILTPELKLLKIRT